MTRFLINILIVVLLETLLLSCSEEEKKPNILFIAVDDLRPELGCYGNPVVLSPNLDKLASEGLVFSNHFVQVPTCGASRHCLLSGMRPAKAIHLSNYSIDRVPDEVIGFALHLLTDKKDDAFVRNELAKKGWEKELHQEMVNLKLQNIW